jgi:hypothetical protein
VILNGKKRRRNAERKAGKGINRENTDSEKQRNKMKVNMQKRKN